MPYSGLAGFISALEKQNELHRISTYVDPVLEIAEITDRITKNNGKALLFEKTGKDFPVLINAFASDKRMALALETDDISRTADRISDIFDLVSNTPSGLVAKLKKLPGLMKLSGFLPTRKKSRGLCQKIIHHNPDLGILPVLKCWPHDGGPFITLPMVHTVHPVTGNSNLGMYRMQILSPVTTGMHWQRHKTGANHFEAWKMTGKRMPVSVTLGGDPVYTYCATAPLPENISEYILAGFLRKKSVRLVKCLTNDLYVPEDADIVIEGYVDPSEPLVSEGPFGDHTGFYSLADLYPVFHVTCISHSVNAVYPATIVGVPPQEDAWLAKTTEKLFLSPLKIGIQPEIIDFHLPEAGIAHNLMIVRINKSYPGQGMKVINALAGAGQMMFTKYIIVVDGIVDIRNYRELTEHVIRNTDLRSDIIFYKGPLDVLDHSSDTFSFGGKAGIDATVKLPEETGRTDNQAHIPLLFTMTDLAGSGLIIDHFEYRLISGYNIIILALDTAVDPGLTGRVADFLKKKAFKGYEAVIFLVDHAVDIQDLYMISWLILGNSDPVRDLKFISDSIILLDGTIKGYQAGKFPRKWPNVVCSDPATIQNVNNKWESLGLGSFLPSPSLKSLKLLKNGNAEIEF